MRALVMLLGMVAAVCVMAASAGAAKPSGVTFHTSAVCGDVNGTFTATGAVEDSARSTWR